jgi:hypothetical protein
MDPATTTLEERLERGELIPFDSCPFALPPAEDQAFLLAQRSGGGAHKDICFNPARNSIAGFRFESTGQADRLRSILADFAKNAATWLSGLVPRYASRWQLDRITLRSEEEATRKLRMTARNDLLHFDAFPTRPTRGWRILRLFVNINPSDARVWATSSTFQRVFADYHAQVGLSSIAATGWARRFSRGLMNLFQPGAAERTSYDEFMLRLHHFLKSCDDFQERSPRRLWHFPPGAAWLLFTDGVTHAELRGRYALDQSFFIASETLALPDEAPAALFSGASKAGVLPYAA